MECKSDIPLCEHDENQLAMDEEENQEHEALRLKHFDDDDHDFIDDNDGTEDEDEDLADTSAWKECWYSRSCGFGIYFILIVLILGSLVSLIVLSIIIILPYGRVAAFKPTKCTVTETVKDPKEPQCSCGKGCYAVHPCIHVRVTYGSPSSRGTLYENEATLTRQCSYYPQCKSSRQVNEKAIDRYVERYGQRGLSYDCLYNPANPMEVIRTRRFQLHHVVHGVVWTSLVLLMATILLIYAKKKKVPTATLR